MNRRTRSASEESKNRTRRHSILCLFALILSLGAAGGGAGAQQLPALSPEQLEQIQQLRNQQQQQQSTTGQQQLQQPLLLSPAPQRSRGPVGVSELEQVISSQIGREIRQFGYDQVGVGSSVTVPQTGAVQDDYVLGPGDKIDISLRGQENSDFTVAVDRNGQISLPKLNPIAAAGRTLGEFRENLDAAIHRNFVGTNVTVSVSQLRQVSVIVAGEVDNPGTRILTGLSSPLDAILLSGGVKKSGSLRNIKLMRNGREATIDLYGVLIQQARMRLINLRDGDRILVPPIGATVAIAGFVRRPAIYELPAGEQATSARRLLMLASGPAVPGVYTTSILHLLPNGERQFVDISNHAETPVHNGESVILKSAVDVSTGRVTLVGAVRTPGAFALSRYPTLHDLLPSSTALQPGAYMLFGIVDRIDPDTMQREALAFSPLHVVQGSENLRLMSDDTVRVLTEDAMFYLLGVAQGPNPNPQPQEQSQQGQEQVSSSRRTGSSQMAASGGSGTPELPGTAGGNPSGQIGEQTTLGATANPQAGAMGDRALGGAQPGGTAAGAAFESEIGNRGAATADTAGFTSADGAFFGSALGDYRVSILGAEHRPGTYLVAPNTTLAEALIAAHGLDFDVDLSGFELTSTVIDNISGGSSTERHQYPATADQLSRTVLKRFDRVIFHHIYSDMKNGVVHVSGEVLYPGSYDILRGEKLSSVLARAGGLTDVAYPEGTVFLRKSVAAEEQDEVKKDAADIRSQMLAATMRPAAGPNAPTLSPEAFVALQNLLSQIETQPALGRVATVADPKLLAEEPKRDLVLDSGDSIVIPKKPGTVSVLGEVLRPGSFTFDSSASLDDYIDKAGGYTEFADTSRVIIVLPDGEARTPESSWLIIGRGEEIPPGSMIVASRDLSGISIHQIIVDTTQIVSQLAVTAASLAVLSKY
jgi:protein involved in polysaccharide export with SLBB domain